MIVSWYRESTYVWKRRASITIDNTGGSAGTIDAEGTLPAEFDDFWTYIDGSGVELRVTAADGTTKLVYSLTGFNKTTRAGTLSIDGMSSFGDGVHQAFLYWDSTGTPTGAAATVITTPKTLYIETCGPGPHIVRGLAPRPGDTNPARKIQKGAGETIRVAFDLAPVLKRRTRPYQGYPYCEEIQWADYVVNLAGNAQSSMKTAANSRLFGGRYIVVDIKAGTTATDYTILPTVRTVDGATNSASILTPSAWLMVKTPVET